MKEREKNDINDKQKKDKEQIKTMDERLFGKTILIGREPINNRLLVSLNHNGKNYLAQIGQQGCVPDCVSRCIPNENKAHCRLNIDPTGTMTIENVKAENITFVDGTQIMKKRVAESNVVEMGKYKHKVTVAEIINAATLIAAKVIPGQANNVNGAAANEKPCVNREYTTLDLYPTTLAALGVQIEGNRLGLGTNLYSGEKTLAEKYGLDYLNVELLKDSKLYRKKLLYGNK